MTVSDPTNGNVSYTVKELLAQQSSKLDTIIAELRGKAERDDLKILEGRVASLELRDAQKAGQSGYSRWVLPVTISIISVGITVAALLAR